MNVLKQNDLFSFLLSQLPERCHIVEVGAFTGNHTIKFVTQKPHAKMYAFEPVPEIYDTLVDRVKQYPAVVCYNYAVSDEEGVKTLYVAKNPEKTNKFSSASSLHRPLKRIEFSPIIYPASIDVPTITLDGWSKRYQMNSQIDLLWIDTQGHEFQVLDGAKELLRFVNFIHTEVHFDNAYHDQKRYTEVIDFLKKHGFTEIVRDFSKTNEWFFGNILFKRNC